MYSAMESAMPSSAKSGKTHGLRFTSRHPCGYQKARASTKSEGGALFGVPSDGFDSRAPTLERGGFAHIATGATKDDAPGVPLAAAAAGRLDNVSSDGRSTCGEDVVPINTTSMGRGCGGPVVALGGPHGQVPARSEREVGERGHRLYGRMVAPHSQSGARSRKSKARQETRGKRPQSTSAKDDGTRPSRR